jgi:Domain of unknown function (DUF1963)
MQFLFDQVKSGRSAGHRNKAWQCLLEMRQAEAFAFAERMLKKVRLDHPFDVYLREVGYRSADTPLYSEECFHLVFPSDYLGADKPPWRAVHPTWCLQAIGSSLRFGGAGSRACGLCGGQLHHLLTLPGSHVFGASGGDGAMVSLETCLSCLGLEREVLFYSQGPDGRPRSLDVGPVTPEFPAISLEEAQVHLVPSPARSKWQDWASANSRENLHRVGGYPSWIQSADYPECPGCSETMRFIMQLDSELPLSDGGEWLWGSGGIGYAFSCAACRNTAFTWQCT